MSHSGVISNSKPPSKMQYMMVLLAGSGNRLGRETGM